MSKKHGPTRHQLQRKIARLEAALAKYERADTLRREGEHWYELIEFFDGEEIRRIPSPFRSPTYLMGMLADAYVVEVPPDATTEEIAGFLKILKQNGIAPCLTIRKGVRFLKLATVSEEKERRLDAADEVSREEETERAGTGAPGADRAGPVVDGHGVGDRLPSDGADPGGGGDHDEPTQATGAQAPHGC